MRKTTERKECDQYLTTNSRVTFVLAGYRMRARAHLLRSWTTLPFPSAAVCFSAAVALLPVCSVSVVVAVYDCVFDWRRIHRFVVGRCRFLAGSECSSSGDCHALLLCFGHAATYCGVLILSYSYLLGLHYPHASRPSFWIHLIHTVSSTIPWKVGGHTCSTRCGAGLQCITCSSTIINKKIHNKLYTTVVPI